MAARLERSPGLLLLPGALALLLAAACTDANPSAPTDGGGAGDTGKAADVRPDRAGDGPSATDGKAKGDGPVTPDGPLAPDQKLPPDQKVKCTVDTECADPLFCTTDLCKQGVCTHTIQTGYCAIGAVCAYKNTVNTKNKCQKCDPAQSTIAWSPHPGGACDDNLACTHSDMCQAGVCKGTAYTCDDKLSCTTDTCTGKPGGCSFSVSKGSCLIKGACVGHGTKDPNNACQRCDAGKDQKAWSQVTPVVATCPWAVSGGSLLNDSAQAVAIDSKGYAYVVGFFYGTANFGPQQLVSKGGRDIFVARVTPAGKLDWAVSAGGTDLDIGLDITADFAGNTRITGYFKGSATFGKTTLTASSGTSDIFVAGLDSVGNFTWAVAAIATGDAYGKAIALDAAGNSYVLGTFAGKGSFAGKSYQAAGTADTVVLKVSSAGAVQWGAQSGGIGGESGTGIAADGSGGAYFTGGYFTSAQFGNISISNNNLAANDIYLARVDGAGKFKWAITAGGKGSDYPGGVAVDGKGNGFVSGHCAGSAKVGAASLSSGGFFLARFDTATGKVTWLNPGWSKLALRAEDLATDSKGNIYAAGFFTGNQTLGSVTLASAGARDVVAFRVSPAGSFTWVASAGGKDFDDGAGIAVSSTGMVRVAGTYEGNAFFGLPSVTLSASTAKNQDIFVWKPVLP